MSSRPYQYSAFLDHRQQLSSHLQYRSRENDRASASPTLQIYLRSQCPLLNTLDHYHLVANLGYIIAVALERDEFFARTGPPVIAMEFYDLETVRHLPTRLRLRKFQEHAIQEMEYRNLCMMSDRVEGYFTYRWNQAALQGYKFETFAKLPGPARLLKIINYYRHLRQTTFKSEVTCHEPTRLKSVKELYRETNQAHTNHGQGVSPSMEEITTESLYKCLTLRNLQVAAEKDMTQPAHDPTLDNLKVLEPAKQHRLGSFFHPFPHLPIPISPANLQTDTQSFRNVIFVVDNLDVMNAGISMITFNRSLDWSAPVQELKNCSEHIIPLSLRPDGVIKRAGQRLTVKRLADAVHAIYYVPLKRDITALIGDIESDAHKSIGAASVRMNGEEDDPVDLMDVNEVMAEFAHFER